MGLSLKKIVGKGKKLFKKVAKPLSWAFPVAAIANIPREFVKSGAAQFYGSIGGAAALGQMSGLLGGAKNIPSEGEAVSATDAGFDSATMAKLLGGAATVPTSGAAAGSAVVGAGAEPITWQSEGAPDKKFLLYAGGALLLLILVAAIASGQKG